MATIRVATWNIHGGVGADGRFDLARIVALLRGAAPDIIALQEVDGRRPAPDHRHAFAFLREALGPHGAEARSIITPDGDYGQLLISRWPLSGIHIHDISVDHSEPRRAIEAAVHSPFGDLRFVATHLGLSFRERRKQSEMLVALGSSPAEVVVMAGDFNDWVWRGSVQRAIRSVLPARTWIRTFPSRFPLIRLDRIHCRPHGALLRSWTDKTARTMSDHLPVFAEISLADTAVR